MGQVVEGEFWLAPDGQPEGIFKPGQTLTLPNRALHNEGATDKGAKVNVVYVVEKGQPLVSVPLDNWPLADFVTDAVDVRFQG